MAWNMVAEEKALPDDRFRVRATLGDDIVISEGRATFRAATRKAANLLKEKQFDVVFIVDVGNPDHPNGLVIESWMG